MKSKDQLLLEAAYQNVKFNVSAQEIRYLAELDRIALEQIVLEGFGDALKNLGKKAVGAVKGAAQKVSGAVISGVVNAILKLIPNKEELINKIFSAAEGKVADAAAIKAAAQDIKKTQTGGDQKAAPAAPGAGVAPVPQTPTKEAIEINKRYLAQFINEEIIVEALEKIEKEYGFVLTESYANGNRQWVLNEMQNVGGLPNDKAAAQKPGRLLAQYAKEVINKIKSLYKDPKSLKAAIPSFVDKITSGLGVSNPTTPTAATPAGDNNTASAGGSNASGLNSAGGTNGPATGTPIDPTKPPTAFPPADAPQTPQGSGNGLISKIWKWIKAHPKISTAAALGLITILLSAGLGAAPVLMPALGKAALGFVAGSGGSVIKQAIQNKMKGDKALANIDWAQAAKTGAKGAAYAAVLVVLGTGLSTIAAAVGEFINPSELASATKVSVVPGEVSSTANSSGANFENGDLKPGDIGYGGGIKPATGRFADHINPMKLKQAIAAETGVKNFSMVGGVPVDSTGKPLLFQDTLNLLQKRFNQPVTDDIESSIQSARKMKADMEGVGGSKG